MDNDSKRLRHLLLFCAFGIIPLVLRLVGLNWGIPDATHYHSYHPDEYPVLWAARNVDFASLSFNTHFYNYGSLYPFCISFVASVAGIIGLLSPGWRSLSSAADLATLHLLARLLTVCFGVATVHLTYRLGVEFCKPPYAFIAAVLVSVYPLHAIHSHYATVDVPATFWSTLALWQAAAAWRTQKLSAYCWSGVASGLAAGTKYNMGLVILAPLAAYFLYESQPKTKPDQKKARNETRISLIKILLMVLVPAGVGFAMACPGLFLAFDEFWRDVSYELFEHSRHGHGLVFVNTGNGWLYHLAVNLRVGMTLPLLLICLIGLGICLWQKQRSAWVLLGFVLIYFLTTGGSQVRFMRYMIPLLPPLAVLCAMGMSRMAFEAGLQEQLSKYKELFRNWRTGLGLSLMLILLIGGGVFALAESLAFSFLLAGEDPRPEAARWIQAQVPKQAVIGLTTEPWYYTPPINPWNGGAKTGQLFKASLDQSPYRFAVTGTEAARLKAEKPDYFIISDFEYGDPLRLQVPSFLEFWDTLHRDYREVARFEKTPRIGPLDFGKRGLPPHDWMYPYPTILVFKRSQP